MLGPKQSSSFKSPRAQKHGQRGNRGLKKGLKEVSLGLKGVKSCSQKEMRLDDGGLSPSAEGLPSMDPLKDPAWICARGPLLDAHENRTGLLGNYSFEGFWEEGLWDVSSDCPLMGYSRQGLGEEGYSDGRSLALVE